MKAKIILQNEFSLIIEWKENGEFGRLRLDWVHEIQRYVLDAENIGIQKILQIINSVNVSLDNQRIYYKQPEKDDEIYTIEDWNECVEEGFLMDDDGSGYWMKDNLISNDEVFGTERLDATHVVWYNK